MSLIRLIVIGLIIYLLIQIFKRWAANKNAASSGQQQNSATNSTSMVQCKTCQLHIPENEALQKMVNIIVARHILMANKTN